jgi:diaminobutyrate-2-oxoglutarate transaminase
VWEAGEHSGTFRGNNLAFVAATKALDFWRDNNMSQLVNARSTILAKELALLANDYPCLHPQVRGIGVIFGLQIEPPEVAQMISRESFARGVIIELCGARNNVLKFPPSLVIEPSMLHKGLGRVREAMETVLKGASYTHSQAG